MLRLQEIYADFIRWRHSRVKRVTRGDRTAMGQATKELFAIDAIERASKCPNTLRRAIEAHVGATGEGIRIHLLSRQARLMACRLLDEGRITERYDRGIGRLYPE